MSQKLSILTLFFAFILIQNVIAKYNDRSREGVRQSDTERLLCREWMLVQESTCDRCPDFYATNTMKLIFYTNYNCQGKLFNHNEDNTGNWILIGNSITITCKVRGNEIKKTYSIKKIDEQELILVYRTYYGSATRKFKSIIK